MVIQQTIVHLIEQIAKDLRLKAHETKIIDIAIKSSMIPTKHHEFNKSFNCHSIIEIELPRKSSQPDTAYSVHQCARFAANPKKHLGDAVR